MKITKKTTNKLNKILFISLWFLSFSLSSYTSYSYEVKYGNGEGLTSTSDQSFKLNFMEHFLRVNGSYNKYDIFLEIEYSDPPLLGYKKNNFNESLNAFYVDRKFRKSNLRLGNIYSLYGAGLSLFTFPDQDIDFDNSIYGFEYKYDFDQINFFILAGKNEFKQRTNPAKILPDRVFDLDMYLIGLDYDLDFGFGHILLKNQNTIINNETLQSFYFPELERYTVFDTDLGMRIDSLISSENIDIQNFENQKIDEISVNFGYGLMSDLGDLYFEVDYIDYNKILGPTVDGSRIYFSYGNSFRDMGITYEYKNYDVPYGIVTLSSPPTAIIESNSILAARNTRSVNYGDEVGHQIELIKPIFNELNLTSTISFSRRKNSNRVEYKRGSGLKEIIESSNFTGQQGSDEDDYLSDLLILSNSIISNPIAQSVQINSNNFFDYITFEDESNNFRSFYPFRQFYTEVSGYMTNNLYFKIGYDIYDEIKEFKNQDFYSNDFSSFESGFSSFYQHAEMIVNDVLSYYETNPIDFCNLIPDCVDNPGEYGFLEQFGESSNDFLSNLSFTDLSNYSEISSLSYKHDSSFTIPMQITYNFGKGNSINLNLEHQNKYIKKHEFINSQHNILKETYRNNYLSASFTGKSFYTLTYFYETQNYKNVNNIDKRSSWSGFDLSFDLSSGGIISIFSGSQKGGIVCANGVCAEQPGFDGVKLTYRTFLN